MKRPCDCCKGKGYYETKLRDMAGKENHSLGISAIVPCDVPACKQGYYHIERI